MNNNLSENIGKRIKKFRQEHELSMAELSKLSGVSISMISKIEHGKSQPPISTYDNIAKGLGVSLSQLFVETNEKGNLTVVKANERYIIAKSNYVASPLSRELNDKKMEPFYCEYLPSETFAQLNTHENQEVLYVLEGVMEFKYGNQTLTLKEGDCINYHGEIPHSARALSPGGVKTILVVSSY